MVVNSVPSPVTPPHFFLMLSALTHGFPPTKGIRWFNLTVLTLTPLVAFYGLWTVKVRRDTGFFAIAYYVFSMLGESRTHVQLLNWYPPSDVLDTNLLRHNCRLVLFYPPTLNLCWKDQDRIPPTLVPSVVQCLAPAPALPVGGGNECGSRFLLLVGAVASVAPPTHRHRFRPIQCESRFALDTCWVDDIQVGNPFGRFGYLGPQARRTFTVAAPPLLPSACPFWILAPNPHSWSSFR
jgi:hypothetical protein